jgi:hypothetical protein
MKRDNVKFKLRFDEALIPELASRYVYPLEDEMVEVIGTARKSAATSLKKSSRPFAAGRPRDPNPESIQTLPDSLRKRLVSLYPRHMRS